MTKPDRATMWQAVLAVYWLALFVATHLPSNFPGLPGERTDKLVHAAMFLGLAWLLATAWEHSAGRLNGQHLRAVWWVVVLYGAADELTQTLVGRSGSLADWLADAVGAALGLVIFSVWRRTT